MSNETPSSPPTELTFVARLEKFWTWFPANAARFYETIESGRCAQLADEVGSFMGSTLPPLSWVFGPGEFGQKQSYIDLVLYNGLRSRDIVLSAVESLHLSGEFAIEAL